MAERSRSLRVAAALLAALLLGAALPAAANEGLQPKEQSFAPLVLTPSGEAMLLDPEGAQDEEAVDGAAAAQPAYGLRESERGGASWYGARFHKRRTASGERFDMHGFTAAHRTLPFGTRVCVRSLLNGRAVEVRINDRGPFHSERVIDLSQAAAEKIGGKGLGIKQVSLAPLAEGAQCADGPPPEQAPLD